MSRRQATLFEIFSSQEAGRRIQATSSSLPVPGDDSRPPFVLSDNSESFLDSVPLQDSEGEGDASPAPYPNFPESPTGVLNPRAREFVPAMNPFANEFRLDANRLNSLSDLIL